MAKDLSAATKTVTDAVTIYANENESVSSMLNKAQPTVLLSAASGMSSSSSADAYFESVQSVRRSGNARCGYS